MDTQDNAKGECGVCGNTEFRPADGFYYCTECGTQSHVLVDVDFEQFGAHNNYSQSKVVKKDALTQEIKSLTSFEEFNYILLGLVNELIELGANSSIKLTAFQLWTAYLKRNEAAFFDKKKPSIPKLGAYFKKKDAEILYNRRKEKKRSSNPSKSAVEDGYKKQRESRKKLDEAEYASFISSRKSNVTLDSLSTNLESNAGSSSIASLPLEYSRVARKHLKRTMPTQHLRQHQVDFTSKLKCHKPQTHEKNRYRPYNISRSTLFCILYLSLNHNSDKIQLSNLINFVREGALSHYFLNKYLPYDPEQLHAGHVANSTQKGEVAEPSHYELRQSTAAFAKLIGLKDLKCPDMIGLSQRYLKELCLPDDIGLYVKRLLSFCPPEMNFNVDSDWKIPNYEGRCMAFIIFILKLIFGLNDVREYELSESARNMNAEMRHFQIDSMELFVFEDWVRFIEMRNVLLAACHYPTQVQFEPDSKTDTGIYLEHIERCQMEAIGTSIKLSKFACYKQLYNIFERLHKDHVRENDTKSPSLLFAPSLTPLRSHFDVLLKEHREMPSFMHKNFDDLNVQSFLKPRQLQSAFRERGVNVEVSRKEIRMDVYNFRELFYASTYDASTKERKTKSFERTVDISEAEWKHALLLDAEERRQANIECKQKIQNQIKIDIRKRRDIEQAEQFRRNDEKLNDTYYKNLVKKKVKNDEYRLPENSMHVKEEEILHEPRRNLDDYDEDLQSDAELKPPEETTVFKKKISFEATNFDYWIFMGSFVVLTMAEFYEIEKEFPKTFMWLLRHCARTINMETRDLYFEVLAVENYFAYTLQPFNKLKLIPQYRKKNNINVRLKRSAELFKKVW